MSNKCEGASVVILSPDRRVLLYLRDNKPVLRYPNCWDLLGGNVEPGESPEQCIRRELLEEIELDLQNPKLFAMYDLEDRIEHTYWAELDLDIVTTPLHEGQRLQWFSQTDLGQLPDPKVAFGFKPILLDFFRKRPWKSGGAP